MKEISFLFSWYYFFLFFVVPLTDCFKIFWLSFICMHYINGLQHSLQAFLIFARESYKKKKQSCCEFLKLINF